MHFDRTNYSETISEVNQTGQRPSPKQPRIVLHEHDPSHPHKIFAFPPNRHTLGATAYLIVEEVNILVDCPAWDNATQSFLEQQGGVHWLFLTHRGGISHAKEIQQAFGCEIAIQEQEAYLLPGLTVNQFEQSLTLTPQTQAIWTPGHSPGSSCLYYSGFGGVMFSGRHLLPTPPGELLPIKTAKTFHWPRQLRSTQKLCDRFTPESLRYICPGANTGFLRGKYVVEQAYQKLIQAGLDVDKQQ